VKALALVAMVTLTVGCKGGEPTPEQVAASASARLAKVAALAPGVEGETAPGVFMTMDRTQATDPIGDGWHRATSTRGGFSVELPLAFNDFRIRSRALDGVEVRSFTVGGKSPGKLSWLATCTSRADGSLAPEGTELPPDRIEMKGDPPVAQQRMVSDDFGLCVLIVEAQGTDPLPPEADRLRFLRSLKRTDKPSW
jgi:hypothetical protein